MSIRWPGMGAEPRFTCETHGEQPWEGHLVCAGCGAAYTSKDEALPTYAPPRCRKCNRRFLPLPNVKLGALGHNFYARPCCSLCFADAPGGAFQDKHGKDSPFCKGEECEFHGPQIRKLKKRAEQAARVAHKKTTVDVVDVQVQVPGMLGMQTMRQT